MKRIINNYLYNLVYQLIVLIIPFATIPYLTRVLGPKNLGIETYTMSVASIFSSFATSGTTVFATRTVANLRDKREEFNIIAYNIFAIRFVIGLIALFIFLVIAFEHKYRYFLFLQIIYLLASTVFDLSWYFAGKERFKDLTTRNLFIKIVGFFLTIILVQDISDLDIYILINGITVLIPNIYFLLIFFREIGRPKREYFSKETFLFLMRSLTPFFLLSLIIQVYINIDKLIIEYRNLTYELGIYSQMIKSFNVFLAPITAIGAILMPFMSNLNFNRSKKEIHNILYLSTNIIFLIGVPIFFGLLVVSKQFVDLYFGTSYIKYLNVFRIGCIIIITGSLSNIIIQQVVIPNFQEKIYLYGLLFATLMRLFILLFFIDSLNIYAAILAYIFSEILLLSYCAVKTKHLINTIPILFNRNNLKIFISGLLMFIILNSLDLSFFKNIIFGCVTYLFVLLVMKENIIRRILSWIYSKRF